MPGSLDRHNLDIIYYMLLPSRRSFLEYAMSGAAMALGTPMNTEANPLRMPIGCQTYPVRKLIANDFVGTMKVLAAAGFQQVELCSPKGYAQDGFAALAKYQGTELKKILEDLNLHCRSSHFDLKELKDELPASIAWAKSLGLTQMMVPSLDGPAKPTIDDVKMAADQFNKIGAKVAGAGIQLGLHNEGFESSLVNGRRTYDLLFDLLDPKLIKFQFQCSEIAHGFIAADYFTRYPDRFISMHVQDWSPATKREVAVGQGSIDWKKTFAAARVGGIQNYFVEMDLPLMKASVPYLKSLSV